MVRYKRMMCECCRIRVLAVNSLYFLEFILYNSKLNDGCLNTENDYWEFYRHCKRQLSSSEYHYVILFHFKDVKPVILRTFSSRSPAFPKSTSVVLFIYEFVTLSFFLLSHSACARSVLYFSPLFFLSSFPPASFLSAFFVNSIGSLLLCLSFSLY